MSKKNNVKYRQHLFFLVWTLLAVQELRAWTDGPIKNGSDPWQEQLLAERKQKDSEFKNSVTSPMAGSVRLTISPGSKTFVKEKNGVVDISNQATPGSFFAVFAENGGWIWSDGAAGVTCRAQDRDVAPGKELLHPGSLFQAGRLTMAAYPGADSLALIVFDPQRPQLLGFKHLYYFPPEPRYAVPARLEKFPDKREVKIPTTRKLEKIFYRYARIRFSIDGRKMMLTAFKSSLSGADGETLFIPFKDSTNCNETYEVGRFLEISEPGQADFVLDFNRCFNPLCNYSPAYNCPLPPLENFLDVAILAGEKTYPH
jgi:uncharacterized protein (DUF1684 family)